MSVDTTEETLYLHTDHLGNVTEVSDESGSVSNVERLAYDAWGKRRNDDWTDASGQIFASGTPRGYTGHEHLDDVSLVHMNGRVYDPDLGRMMSADPYVQQPSYSQSYNRYSYVQNNPLTFSDPSGYCIASRPSCPVGGLAGGTMGAHPANPGLSVTFFHIPIFRTPFMTWGGGLGGAGCTGQYGDGYCNHVYSLDDQGNWIGSFQSAYSAFTQFVSWATVAVVEASTPAPNQTQGQVNQHHMGVYFENADGAFSPRLAESGPSGKVPSSILYVSQNDETTEAENLRESQRALTLEIGRLQRANGGLETWRSFRTADDAAKAVLSIVAPLSRQYGLEVGGNIVKVWVGNITAYRYTLPEVGGRTGVPVSGDSIGYHTHPNGSILFSDYFSSAGGPFENDVAWVRNARKALYVGAQRPDDTVGFAVCEPGNCRNDVAGVTGRVLE